MRNTSIVNSIKIIVVLTGVIIGCPNLSWARGGANSGFTFNLGLFYNKVDTQTKTKSASTDNSTADRTTYDLNFGYLLDNSVYLGFLHSTSSCNNMSPGNGSHQGFAVGYHFNENSFFHLHYVFSATEGSYVKGSGLQADLGYTLAFSGSAHVGTMLSYRTFTYKEGPSSSIDSYTFTEVIPMFVIGFNF